MSVVECPTCGAAVPAEARFCSECGSPNPFSEGVETRLRTYWSAPDLGLLAGIVLAGAGVVLLGAQVWLWAAVALVLAAAVFLIRWEAGRRRTGAAIARLSAHRRIVGRHSRVPRRYRGLDIWWWMDQLGTFAKTIDEVSDVERVRREGSVQLAGRSDHRDVDLPTLQARGVTLAGRLVGIDGPRAQFADDLRATTGAADGRMRRIFAEIDDHIASSGLEEEVLPPAPIVSVAHGSEPRQLDLRRRGVSTVVWATGFTRPYPWLQVPVLDRAGEILQRRGVTPVPGLFVLGQRFQYRRDSNFIDGVRHDAAHVAAPICHGRRPARLAS